MWLNRHFRLHEHYHIMWYLKQIYQSGLLQVHISFCPGYRSYSSRNLARQQKNHHNNGKNRQDFGCPVQKALKKEAVCQFRSHSLTARCLQKPENNLFPRLPEQAWFHDRDYDGTDMRSFGYRGRLPTSYHFDPVSDQHVRPLLIP